VFRQSTAPNIGGLSTKHVFRQSHLYRNGGRGHSKPNGPPHWKIFTIFPLQLTISGVLRHRKLAVFIAQYVTVGIVIKR